MAHELTQDSLRRALAGDEAALTRVAEALTPIVQARVARCLLLWRTGAAAGRSIRQEVADLTQDVFLTLFADGGKVLRTWDPERGLSLANFVGLVAERRAASMLRSGKRSPWTEDPAPLEELDTGTEEQDPETDTATREELRLILRRLTEELTPLGRHLFDLLFLERLPVKDIVRRVNMSPDAVYAWRSRLRRHAHRLRAQLSGSARRRRIP